MKPAPIPPKLKRLSGGEAAAILALFGFSIISRRGSHAKLRRITEAGERQTLTVPMHRELDAGTLRALFRQASRSIPAEALREHFYAG